MDRKPRGIARGKGQKIVVGMSGGVDSTAALIILKENGWNPVGVSLKFSAWKDSTNIKENSCCTNDSIKIAKKVCKQFGCEHHVIDISKEFQKNVIEYFVDSLKKSLTPNPCMVCNRNTKFFHLVKFADSMGIDYISTGHYSKLTYDKELKSIFVTVPKDKTKDQTYYLSLLPQEWLKRIIFPLGEVTKERTYKIARLSGIDFYKKVKQSQDFCFVSEKSMDRFMENEIGDNPGDILDQYGKVIGKHKGLHYYTIGQRKKIGLGGGPYYVIEKDFEKNTLTVSRDKKDLGQDKINLTDVFFPSKELYKKEMVVKAKIRYQQKMSKAKIIPDKKSPYKCVVEFEKPQLAVTPGQYCVFYKGKVCIGSGVITD